MEGGSSFFVGFEQGLTSPAQHRSTHDLHGSATHADSLTTSNRQSLKRTPVVVDQDAESSTLEDTGSSTDDSDSEPARPSIPAQSSATPQVQESGGSVVRTSDAVHLCNICNKGFARAWDLKRHKKLHFDVRAFACSHPGCTRTFIQRSALTVHTRVHTGERPHACTFPGCSRAFGDSSALARHRRLHDADPLPFKCPWDRGACRGQFLRKDSLVAHMKGHDRNWEPGPDFARNWVSNALPKKSKRARKRRRLQSSKDDDEDDGDEDEEHQTITELSTLFSNAVQSRSIHDQGRPQAMAAGIKANAHPSQCPTTALSETLANALEQVMPVARSQVGFEREETSFRSRLGTDKGADKTEVARLLVEALGGEDEDDGLLTIELRPRAC